MDDLTADPDVSFDEQDPHQAATIAEHYAGTYNAGWGALKTAATSGLLVTAKEASKQIQRLPRVKAGTEKVGEASMVLLMNYRWLVVGPALGTVVLCAFALESFLRLAFQIAAEQGRTRAQRRKGLDERILVELQRYDRLSIPDKIGELEHAWKLQPRDDQDPVRSAAAALARYRNDLAHDSPILVKEALEYERPGGKGKRPKDVSPEMDGFERVGLNNTPARLKHALMAAEAHDNVVERFIEEGEERLRSAIRRLDSALGARIRDSLQASVKWEQLHHVSNVWEQEMEPIINCSLQELEDVRGDLRRRINIHRA